MQIESDGNARGVGWSARILIAFHDGTAASNCRRSHPDPAGYVDLALALQSDRVQVLVSGPLAEQPGGVCFRRALEDLIAADPVPKAVTKILTDPLRMVIE